ncbi:serine/threonine-protein kinase [Nannocystis pusilla]|uniref:serine/threonine-protein kinase n=1 Tax=Nannocystis pusilla TaxID=889268 RepID=UPI003B77CB1E
MSPGEQDRTVLPRRCPTCGEHFPLDYKVCPRHAVELIGVDSQTDDPYIGSTLAEKYRIEAVIGDGGMGRVYEAKHVRMPGRTVAVKILHRVLASDAEVVSRFRREAEIAGTIVHPNVVQIHDVDQTIDGTPFIVCERLVGEDLGQHLDRVGRIGVRETVHILRQAAAVLMVAHSRGVIHRDLKPTNLFLVGDPASPTVKLIDFGIAKLHDPKASQTQTGMIMGTPAYMAPEQARGSKVDGRADLYALGAIAYRCVTGRPPFDIDDAAAALHAVLTSSRRGRARSSASCRRRSRWCCSGRWRASRRSATPTSRSSTRRWPASSRRPTRPRRSRCAPRRRWRPARPPTSTSCRRWRGAPGRRSRRTRASARRS